jgi:hypothetical protein
MDEWRFSKSDSDGSKVVVIGSRTTWGELRTVADALQLYNGILTANKSRPQPLIPILFIAGTFQPLAEHEITPGRQHPWLTHPPLPGIPPFKLLTEEILASARAANAFSPSSPLSFRRWLSSYSGGAPLLRAASPSPTSTHLSGLPSSPEESDLLDFNVQLYVEALAPFRDPTVTKLWEPKVEYSGSLHTCGGPSIAVLLAGDAADDVASEGGGVVAVRVEVRQEDGNRDYEKAGREILDIAGDKEKWRGIMENNVEAAKRSNMEVVARMYAKLIN